MGTQRADFEPFAWWLAGERIGADLREYYAASQALPSQILELVEKLDDVVESERFREESLPVAPSLLSKLDAIEGNQLLRASKTRLQRFGAIT